MSSNAVIPFFIVGMVFLGITLALIGLTGDKPRMVEQPALALESALVPPADDVSTFVRGTIEGKAAAWRVRYRINWVNDEVTLILKINFIVPDGTAFSEAAVCKQIEDQWNNKVIVRHPDEGDVKCVMKVIPTPAFEQADHVVWLKDAVGRSSVHEWFLKDMKHHVAAHEAGHMIGLYDEYPDGAHGSKWYYTADGLMGYGARKEIAKMHTSYYEPWLNYIGSGELVYVVQKSDQATKTETQPVHPTVLGTPTQQPEPQYGWPNGQRRGLFRGR